MCRGEPQWPTVEHFDPYRLDVTSTLQQGDNVLEIKVTNLLLNRITGDYYRPWKNSIIMLWAIDVPDPCGKGWSAAVGKRSGQ